jgi:hypothetical protein
MGDGEADLLLGDKLRPGVMKPSLNFVKGFPKESISCFILFLEMKSIISKSFSYTLAAWREAYCRVFFREFVNEN